MTTTTELLQRCFDAGVVLRPNGDRLTVRGPEDAISELEPELAARKPEILKALSTSRVEAMPCPGDECGRQVLFIDGLGWCPGHGMSVQLVRKGVAVEKCSKCGGRVTVKSDERWDDLRYNDLWQGKCDGCGMEFSTSRLSALVVSELVN